jgi:hypothetical protein
MRAMADEPRPWVKKALGAGPSGCETFIDAYISIPVGLQFDPEWIT